MVFPIEAIRTLRYADCESGSPCNGHPFTDGSAAGLSKEMLHQWLHFSQGGAGFRLSGDNDVQSFYVAKV